MAQRKQLSAAEKLDRNLFRRFVYHQKKVIRANEDPTNNLTVSVPTFLGFVRNKPLDSTFFGLQSRNGNDRDDVVRQRHSKRVYDSIQAEPDPKAAERKAAELIALRLPGYDVELVDHLSHTTENPAQKSYAFSVKKTPKKR